MKTAQIYTGSSDSRQIATGYRDREIIGYYYNII